MDPGGNPVTTERGRARALLSPLPYLLAPVPALALGVLVMQAFGVPAAVWGQNLAAWAVGTLVCLGLWRTRNAPGRGRWAVVVAAVALGTLAATFLAPDVQGVHRWVRLGPVRLHAAALLLPVLLVAIDGLERVRGWWTAALVALGATLALALQPDAAQATAFAAAAGLLLLPGASRRAPRLICIGTLAVLAGVSWLRSDPLAPVPHVEGIVRLAGSLGAGWGVAALASLVLLPLPFLLAARGAGRVGLALSVYVAITLLAPAVGNFPVPIMGHGMSPILGYLAAMGVFLRVAARRQERGSVGSL